MGPDDKICYCYNVTLRKLCNFARQTRPHRPSQLSDCLGAGTGCGWCIPVLKRIFEECEKDAPSLDLGITPEEYAKRRKAYIDEGHARHEF